MGGIAGDAGAIIGEVGSFGLATPAAFGLATVSTATISHGTAVAARAADNLKNDRGRVNVEAKDPYSRVKPRKGTVNEVTNRQPKNSKGEMLNPNTGQPIDPKRKDLGHKPGQEWRIRKEMHKNNGSSRKEVINSENNPDLYQWEDRSSNRSHKYEKN